MNKFISLNKMSKKCKKEYFNSKRLSWGVTNPVTRYIPNKKKSFKDYSYMEEI